MGLHLDMVLQLLVAWWVYLEVRRPHPELIVLDRITGAFLQ